MVTKEQIVDLAYKIIDSQTSSDKKKTLLRSFKRNVNQFVISNGGNLQDFEEKRRRKLQRNGGFSRGYIMREKVLPIGEGSALEKLRRDTKRDVAAGAEKIIGKINEYGIWPMQEKLVRDHIPEIAQDRARQNYEIFCSEVAKQEGTTINEVKKRDNPLKDYKAKIRRAKRDELVRLLRQKLDEETVELLASKEKEDLFEDLADTLDIIEAFEVLAKDKN